MMTHSDLPLTRDLVLVGGGHSHALVLRMWGMAPLAGVRLTVINPGPTAPYSGMLPGFVAGHYPREALDIDLVQLARFAGARLVLGAATAIDPQTKQIHLPGRPAIAYDVASVDIGITSDMPALAGFGEHARPAKPLGAFATAWEAFRDGTGPARIACIGGGVAGVELILAMAHALRQQNRLAEATLIDAGAALSALGPRSIARLQKALRAQQVTVLENAPLAEVTATGLRLQDGREIASDFTVGAAGARPYGWLQDTGLTHHEGALVVTDRLQTSDPDIFASGDCVHMAFAPRPKAGVFAVRQAPVLFHNLRAALSGGRMRRYRRAGLAGLERIGGHPGAPAAPRQQTLETQLFLHQAGVFVVLGGQRAKEPARIAFLETAQVGHALAIRHLAFDAVVDPARHQHASLHFTGEFQKRPAHRDFDKTERAR